MTKSDVPPDRGHLPTEARLRASSELDTLTVRQMLELINREDRTVAEAVGNAIPQIARLVDRIVESLRGGGRLVYLGAGTSGRLGVLDASECPPTFQSPPEQVVGVIAGGDGALRKSSEGKEDDPRGSEAELTRLGVGVDDVVVGLAASGTTPYVLGGIAIARQRGAATGLVCCVNANALPEHEAAHVVAVPVGAEVVTGSTRMKAGTATKLVLNMITTATMNALGKTWGNLMVDLRASNAKLRDRAARIVMSQTTLDRPGALELLDQAHGSVKVALVMAHRHVDRNAAIQLLDAHESKLRPIIGPPRD